MRDICVCIERETEKKVQKQLQGMESEDSKKLSIGVRVNSKTFEKKK